MLIEKTRGIYDGSYSISPRYRHCSKTVVHSLKRLPATERKAIERPSHDDTGKGFTRQGPAVLKHASTLSTQSSAQHFPRLLDFDA
jgi:hypothetical protein